MIIIKTFLVQIIKEIYKKKSNLKIIKIEEKEGTQVKSAENIFKNTIGENFLIWDFSSVCYDYH